METGLVTFEFLLVFYLASGLATDAPTLTSLVKDQRFKRQNACAAAFCGEGRCISVPPEDCQRPPCRHVAQCVPFSNTESPANNLSPGDRTPCALAFCGSGYCINIPPPSDCRHPQCKYTPRCVPYDQPTTRAPNRPPYYISPEEEAVLRSPCARVSCNNAYCVDEPDRNCRYQPCQRVARCVPFRNTYYQPQIYFPNRVPRGPTPPFSPQNPPSTSFPQRRPPPSSFPQRPQSPPLPQEPQSPQLPQRPSSPCSMAYCHNSTCVPEQVNGCPSCPKIAKCMPHQGSTFSPDPEYHCGEHSLQCKQNQHCELVQVQCFAAPCPPIPTCFNTTGITCANVSCRDGPCYMTQVCDGPGSCRYTPSCQQRRNTYR